MQSGLKDSQEGPSPKPASPTAFESSNAAFSGDYTLVEPERVSLCSGPAYNDQAKSLNKAGLEPSRSVIPPEHPKDKRVETDPSPKTAQEPSELSRAGNHNNAADARAKKRKQAPVLNHAKTHKSSRQDVTPPEGDLIQMLFDKHQESDRERAELLRSLKVKEAEYQELFGATEDIYTQLEDMKKQFSDSEAKLARIAKAKPEWESKVKKLSDYIKGLTNDHNRLRDDANSIRDRQGAISQEKQSILETLRNVHQASEERHITSKRLVTEARHEMESLAHLMNDQRTQMQRGEELLKLEQEDKKSIEENFAAATAVQARLIDTLGNQCDMIPAKLTEVVAKLERIHATTPPSSQDHLQPLLEQCISMIQQLSSNESGAAKKDIQTLNDSVSSKLNE